MFVYKFYTHTRFGLVWFYDLALYVENNAALTVAKQQNTEIFMN